MNRITIGFATIFGTLGAAATALAPMLGELAGAAEPLGVPPQVWMVLSAVLASIVVLGRMAQAVAATLAGDQGPAPEPGDLVHPAPTVPSDAGAPSA